MPKKISSLPTGAINKTDNLITASSGSDELKRNTVDELLAEPNAEISALQTENAELKAQITEMEEQISELNSNLTPTSGTVSLSNSSFGSGSFTWHKYGQICFIASQITNCNYGLLTVSSWNTIASGFPQATETHYGIVSQLTSSPTAVALRINSSGELGIYLNSSTSTTSINTQFCITYIVA